ncbi:prepilin-type N-terminal cleavage/methylation domain-containing protein [Tautonia sociabilis]|uniref:Prepilin-type N-terminal cleavage/methylation domain-containing protein n=1 Tax=Tautonia sociabilis TaxID=2080755 RepID=A0A432MES4_9BACT|nr:prepilin-type N-terminal cleavage/methylation domain-containing protein [Tautonia sociabilis]RUL84183.1 hypothetical protein TsocGM_20880 [Tautonia sociabilis]
MPPRPRRRTGFTLVEMACAVVLTGLLGVLLVSAWGAFGVPAVESYRRGRLAREAMMAAASLAADLGGSLPSPVGRYGGRDEYALVSWRTTGGDDLELWFDGPPADGTTSHSLPDLAVIYWVDPVSSTLRRWDQATGTTTVVSSDTVAMAVETDYPGGGGDQLAIVLTFQYRDIIRQHTFIASKP